LSALVNLQGSKNKIGEKLRMTKKFEKIMLTTATSYIGNAGGIVAQVLDAPTITDDQRDTALSEVFTTLSETYRLLTGQPLEWWKLADPIGKSTNKEITESEETTHE